MVKVYINITRRKFLALDCRLALNVLRTHADAPLLVFAKALADIKRLAECTTPIDRLPVGDALLAVLRLLRREVDRAARRLRVRRSVNANRRT